MSQLWNIQRLRRAKKTCPHPPACVLRFSFFLFHRDRLPEKPLERLLSALGLEVHPEPQRLLADLQEIQTLAAWLCNVAWDCRLCREMSL